MLYCLQTRQVGNVQSFCNGRVWLGPDIINFLIGLLLISVSTLLFVCYTNTIAVARVLAALWGLLSLAAILRCAFTNPGIGPKLPRSTEAGLRPSQWYSVVYTHPDGSTGQRQVERKWCYTCNHYRPYRGVHCKFCDVCVERRDHHCPWTGTCIGSRNYFMYYVMLWILTGLMLTGSIGSIASLAKRTARAAELPPRERQYGCFVTAIMDTYLLEIFVLVVSCLFGLMVGVLAVQHTYLAARNLTSAHINEHDNCYDQGSIIQNMRLSFCNVVPPSFHVDCEEAVSASVSHLVSVVTVEEAHCSGEEGSVVL